MAADNDFTVLEAFLRRMPTIVGPIGTGALSDGRWWVKFAIDIDHPSTCAEWIDGRLPRPVDDLGEWETDAQDE